MRHQLLSICGLGASALLAILGGAILWQSGGRGLTQAWPEDGRVTGGVYSSPYFRLSFPLPAGWTEGLAGPPPSRAGYYVLGRFVPKDAEGGTMLIAAQDQFLADDSFRDAATMLARFGGAVAESEGLTVDRGVTTTSIAGHRFSRIDFSGAGIYRTVTATESRCHIVTITLTAAGRERLEEMARSLDTLAFADADAPLCLRDYASGARVLRRIEPAMAEAKFVTIAARIIVDAEGRVGHVHVIRALPEQEKSISDAVVQWKFRPYFTGGRAVSVETGVSFALKPNAPQ